MQVSGSTFGVKIDAIMVFKTSSIKDFKDSHQFSCKIQVLKEPQNIRSDIPVILCTGFSEKMDKDKANELSATGYLEKPHDKGELAKMVREVLDG